LPGGISERKVAWFPKEKIAEVRALETSSSSHLRLTMIKARREGRKAWRRISGVELSLLPQISEVGGDRLMSDTRRP